MFFALSLFLFFQKLGFFLNNYSNVTIFKALNTKVKLLKVNPPVCLSCNTAIISKETCEKTKQNQSSNKIKIK